MNSSKPFTPALGYTPLTPLYDIAIAVLTREKTWRDRFVAIINPQPGDQIVDVGCGTGSLAIQMKKAAPEANIIAIDPDPDVLERAKIKAEKAGHVIDWREGFLMPGENITYGSANKIVSSLVFHQTASEEKKNILKAMWDTLEQQGRLYIADYGLQRVPLMRAFYRCTVQLLDGVENTRPNGLGKLPDYIHEAHFQQLDERSTIPTATGSISIYHAAK